MASMLTSDSLSAPEMVGLENTDFPRHEFYVHQALIDELCRPLCDELRGYWKVFDGETVGRLAQYLYLANCDFPGKSRARTTALPGTVSGGPMPTTPGDIRDFSGGASLSDEMFDEDGMGSEDEMSDDDAAGAPVYAPLPRMFSARAAPPHPTVPPKGPVALSRGNSVDFLMYAKLYILSYSQGIDALSNLCISHLSRELGAIPSPPVDPQILENIVALLRYVYCSPRDAAPPKPLQPAWTKLQGLASKQCAPNIDVMAENQEFTELLQGGGALARDILVDTVRRLRSVEANAENKNKATGNALVRASRGRGGREGRGGRGERDSAYRRMLGHYGVNGLYQ